MPDFSILSEKNFEKADVEVLYISGDSNAMPKDHVAEALIEEIWPAAVREAKKRHVNIFNGNLFRLKNVRATSDNGLMLELGDTNYREYVATRSDKFRNNRQPGDMANPLATCIAIGTSDGKVIIEKRGGVDVYSGKYHVIGGFMDRPQDLNNGIPDPFKAIGREVKEEVGLTLRNDRIQMTGLVYDRITPHFEICFCTESSLLSKEILDIFVNSEKDCEVDKLEFIDASEDKLAKFISSRRHLIAVTGQACLTLYGKHRYGTTWFHAVMNALG